MLSPSLAFTVRLALFFGVFGAATVLPAATITLAPVADTTLFQNNPTNNLGAEPTLVSGTTANGMRSRTLLKFDVSSLPRNAIIHTVTFNITVVNATATDALTFGLHRMLRSWQEGTGKGTSGGNNGSGAKPGETTWLASSHPDTLWSAPGAAAPSDFVAEESASQDLVDEAIYTFEPTPTIAADVQQWLSDPNSNFGWILIAANETTAGTARRFGSREDAVNAPSIVIDYILQPPPHVNFTPVADTSLFELNPDNNLGAATLVAGATGANQGGLRGRALIQFSVTNLPHDVVFTSAYLTLNAFKESGTSPANSNFDLHRMLRPWGEGNKSSTAGSPATAGEATWNASFFPSTLWSAPGASAPVDFSPAVSATTFIAGTGFYAFTNLLPDVLFWRDHPEQNYGWILMSESESTLFTARRFVSRDDPTTPPVLTVEYFPKPVLTQTHIAGEQLIFSFVAQPAQAYVVQCKDSLSTGTWSTYTNVPGMGSMQTITVASPLNGTKRFYRVVAQ